MAGMSGLLSKIPGTEQYAQKYFLKFLSKRLGSGDVLLEVEYDDRKVAYKSAQYDEEIGAYIDEDKFPYFLVSGSEYEGPKDVGGIPIVHVASAHAAPLDTKFCRVMERISAGDYIPITENGDIIPREELGLNTVADGPSVDADGSQGAVADGGMITGSDHDRLVPLTPGKRATDLNLKEQYVVMDPDTGEAKYRADADGNPAFVGEIVSTRAAKQRVSNAISPKEVKHAVAVARDMGYDQSELLKYCAISLGIGVAIPVIFFVVLWFLSQFGGGGGHSVNIGLGVISAGFGGL